MDVVGVHLATGIVLRRQVGDSVTFAIAGWVPWVVCAAALLLIAVGIFMAARLHKSLSRSAGWAGGVMFGAGGTGLLMVALALPRDRVIVRPDGFVFSRGVRSEDVRFTDCEHVELLEERFRGRFGVENRLHTLRWHLRGGKPPISMALEGPAMDARYDLISKADGHGVPGAKELVWRIITLP